MIKKYQDEYGQLVVDLEIESCGFGKLVVKSMTDENEFEIHIIESPGYRHPSNVTEINIDSKHLDLMIAYLTKMKEEFNE